MIVATAGHVDHGKTSLVRCLTGVDTDRMEEEKRRGLSINLGYAYLPTERGLPLGFIDVPGHKRFINNMICGISGIDMGLLLVAADDGVMPQTLEHLDVLALLGVERLAIAISKVDRASAARVSEVGAQVQALCTARGWDKTALYPVSSTDGTGIESLKDYLLGAAQHTANKAVSGCFRLSIDRAFNIKGTGLVVTGTVLAGRTQLNDTLLLTPGNKQLRVRGLRVHDADASEALAGQRCAINLGGDVELQDIIRGDRLVALQAGPASDRIDVSIALLDALAFPLKHMSQVKMHIGASRLTARVALLDPASMDSRLRPGERAFAQLLLERPLACTRLERFVLRDDSGEVLLGGGHVLDPHGQKPSRSRRDYVEQVQAMALEGVEAALTARLALGNSVDIGRFEWSCNLPPGTANDYLKNGVQTYGAGDVRWAIKSAQWEAVAVANLAYLQKFHAVNPSAVGIRAALLTRDLEKEFAPHLLRAALGRQIQQQQIVLKEGRLFLHNFRPHAAPEQDAAWQKVAGMMHKSGNNILLMSELLEQTGMPQKKLQHLMLESVRQKRVHQVSERRYALPDQLAKLAHELIDFAQAGNDITVKALKTHWGTGRNITVEILEYFDRIRFTQRKDNVRVILDKALPAKLYDS
jgi:selenocysteine-specific elongation factor